MKKHQKPKKTAASLGPGGRKAKGLAAKTDGLRVGASSGARARALDDLEKQVVRRLRSYPPASWQDLITEGLLTEGQANTMRSRLRDRLEFVGTRPSGSRSGGRPHKLVTVGPK